MNRRLLAALALVALVALAGCSSVFGSDADDPEALSADADYDFETERDAAITVNQDNYTAVYNVSAKVTGDDDTIQLYETDALAIERPLELSALQFQYANGTRIRYVDGEPTRVYANGSTEPTDAMGVSSSRQRTTVQLPAEEGRLAFTTPKNGKEVAVQPPVHGSYQVTLPPGADADLPLLSQVTPSNDDREVVDGRVALQWDDLGASVLVVRWYLERDLWLFGGLTVVTLVVGALGSVRYYLQIQRAKARREEAGLDVDVPDDGRDPPPPGMR